MTFGVGDLEIAAVEVGYIVAVAVLTKALGAATKRLDRWRLARGVRQLWKAAEQEQEQPQATCDYRTNAANAANPTRMERSTWLSRRRAERAARYVQKLEVAATMKG